MNIFIRETLFVSEEQQSFTTEIRHELNRGIGYLQYVKTKPAKLVNKRLKQILISRRELNVHRETSE